MGSFQSLRFGNHAITLLSVDETVSWILANVDKPRGPCKQVMASGFHGMWSVVSDSQTASELEDLDLWVPDGIAPIWISRVLGARGVGRAPGPEIFPAVMAAARNRGKPLRHFLYGDTEATLSALGAHIEDTYPNNVVAGTHSPPFTPRAEEAPEETLAAINSATPDIIWVGLGTPKQDLWIARNRNRLNAPVAVAVGAAFRFEIGKVERAPAWIGRSGLEWAFRLSREPKKLWRRVFVEGAQFLAWSGGALVRGDLRVVDETDVQVHVD
jgi:N-acetylglucosaminyldiphosphoundecaprenol N-acetyl-beta-D-mannosaminyltransferase